MTQNNPEFKLMTPGKWYADFDDNGNATETYYDESFRKLLGFDESSFRNDQESWAVNVHPDDRERVDAYFADIMAKHPEGMDYDIEYRILTRWGYHWFHDYARISRRENGSVLHFEGVSFDIQHIKDFEFQQAHDNLKREVLDYMVSHDEDPIELLSRFAEKIRVLIDCDQVIYRDLEKTRIMVNSPAIEKTWSVPESYCRQCQHFDAHHPMYKDGFTEMDNCQEGWQGIPVYEKCPIKSSLTRIVYCNGEVAGYFAIHYVQKYHHFNDIERKTIEEFVRNLSIIMSRYESNREVAEFRQKEEMRNKELVQNNQRVMALEDNFESLYDVELDSGRYTGYVKGDFYQTNVADKLLPPGDYFEDLRGNIDAVIYPEDRDGLNHVLERESIRKALAETDRIEYFYRMFVGSEPVWFKIRIVYKDAEKKNIIIGCFNASEELEAKQIEEQRAQIAEQATFTNFFLETYVSAYYVDLDTLSCKVYKRTDQLEKDYPIITNYYDSLMEYIDRDVHPDDRKELIDAVAPVRMREILDRRIEYSHIFRDMSGGKEKTYRMQVIKGGRESHAAFGFVDITDEISEQNKRLKEAEETKKLVNNIATEYNVAYIVNMKDDSFKELRMDKDVLGSGEKFTTFTQAKEFFIDKACHPADKEMMARELDYDNIRGNLSGRRSFEVEYRALVEGSTIWHRMNVTSIGVDDVAIGFVKKDLEIVKRRLEEKKFNEYLALYVVDLDTETIKPFRTSTSAVDIEDAPSVPFSMKIKEFSAMFGEDAKPFFNMISDLSYLRDAFTKDEKRSFAYKLPQGKWVDFSCYVIARHSDGTPSMCAFGYSDSDALSASRNEMQQKLEVSQKRLQEDMEMISGLANEYHALYYLNISEGFFKVYSIDEKRFPEARQMILANVGAGGSDARELFMKFGASPLVHPDDRHLFLDLSTDSILEKLSHSKKFTRRFRRKFGDEFLWTEMEFIKYEDIDQPANIIAVGFAERDAEIRSEETLNKCFSVLGESIPPQQAIDKLMALAGEFYGAGRAYIFEFGKGKEVFSNTYEWCKEGVEPMISQLQNIPYKEVAGWVREFERQGAFFMDALDSEHNTPEGAALLEMQGIGSLIAAPIYSGDEIIGFIGVDDPTKAKTNVAILKDIAVAAYSEILKRKENDEEHLTLEKIADTFLSVYYADLSQDYMHNWKIAPEYKASYGYVQHYSESMGGYVQKYVAERDRERSILMTSPEYVREQFKTKDRFSIETTDILLGYERNVVFDYVKVDEEGDKVVICCRDVTETLAKERQQQRQLEAAVKAAEVANKSKSDFLFNMSHDIRTPMNAITGFTAMAKKHLDDKERVVDYLDKIELSGHQLLMLINQVLEMSRIESGKIEFDEDHVDIKNSYDALVTILSEQANVAGLEFFHSFSGIRHRHIIADNARMSQITLNIAGNAIKYTPKGGRIDFSFKELDCDRKGYGRYLFTVSDTGIGMSEEYQKMLFEPFSREKSSTVSKIQGTGLGLSIVKRLVDLLGGTIEVKSKLGEGTRFDVTIDFKLDTSAEMSCQTSSSSAASGTFRGRRVLLVEDNELNREIAKFLLEDQGLLIEEAEDGDIAVKKVRSVLEQGDYDYYDFILMDIQMPRMNGYEATRRIREIPVPDGVRIPIIAMTANAFEEDRQNAISAGMDEHIAKPIDVKQLWSTLAKFI